MPQSGDILDNDEHWHWIKTRSVPDFCGFVNGSGSRETYIASLLSDEDVDDKRAGPHRPLGGQNLDLAFTALRNSGAVYNEAFKMRVCPVIAVSEIEGVSGLEQICEKDGRCRKPVKGVKYAQEIRLVPSNVRVTNGKGDIDVSPIAQDRKQIAGSLLENSVDVSGFCAHLLKSGIETIFLTQRTAKATKDDKFSAYTYSDANPLRDSPIDITGRMYYADLESLVRQETSSFWLLQDNIKEAVNQFTDLLMHAALLELQAKKIFTETYNSRYVCKFIKENYKDLVEAALPEGITMRFLPENRAIRTHAELGEDAINLEADWNYDRYRQVIL